MTTSNKVPDLEQTTSGSIQSKDGVPDLKKNETKKFNIVHETFSLILIVVGVLAFKSIFIANYTVPTGSMIPNILIGDKLIVNKMAYNLRIPFTDIALLQISKPERGDVIVFDSPPDPSTSYVKRLVGLPGDTIEVTDGLISINGEPLKHSLSSDEELFYTLLKGGIYEETMPNNKRYSVQRLSTIRNYRTRKWVIPEGQYFAMGDNRDNSNDSRVWGFVPFANIKGKAKFVYLSLDWQEDSWIPAIRTERFGFTF